MRSNLQTRQDPDRVIKLTFFPKHMGQECAPGSSLLQRQALSHGAGVAHREPRIWISTTEAESRQPRKPDGVPHEPTSRASASPLTRDEPFVEKKRTRGCGTLATWKWRGDWPCRRDGGVNSRRFAGIRGEHYILIRGEVPFSRHYFYRMAISYYFCQTHADSGRHFKSKHAAKSLSSSRLEHTTSTRFGMSHGESFRGAALSLSDNR